MAEPRDRLINTTPTEGIDGVENLPDDAPAPAAKDIEHQIVFNAEQLADMQNGLEAISKELSLVQEGVTGRKADAEKEDDAAGAEKAVDVLGKSWEGLRIEDGVPVLEVPEEQFRAFIGLDTEIIPPIPPPAVHQDETGPDAGAEATDRPTRDYRQLVEAQATDSIVMALKAQVSSLTQSMEDLEDEVGNLGEKFSNESMSFSTEDECLQGGGWPYDDLSINLNSSSELQWRNWDSPAGDTIDETELADDDLFGLQDQDSAPTADTLKYIRADDLGDWMIDYFEASPPWPQYWYELLDTHPDASFDNISYEGWIPIVTDQGGPGPYELKLSDPSLVDDVWWVQGGDETNCFGGAIGDSSNNPVIDLDLLTLDGDWETNGTHTAVTEIISPIHSIDVDNFWSASQLNMDVSGDVAIGAGADMWLGWTTGLNIQGVPWEIRKVRVIDDASGAEITRDMLMSVS